jgi:hypothetical protein
MTAEYILWFGRKCASGPKALRSTAVLLARTCTFSLPHMVQSTIRRSCVFRQGQKQEQNPRSFVIILYIICFLSCFLLYSCYQQAESKKTMFIQIPQGAIIARYEAVGTGFAVVTPNHKVLAPSFYHLRHRYNFFMSINGAGGWVVLLPKPTASQPALF